MSRLGIAFITALSVLTGDLGLAWAGTVLTGTASYEDMNFNLEGFTNIRQRPIRRAIVEAADWNGTFIYARTTTAEDGSFELILDDIPQSPFVIQVLSLADRNAGLYLRVVAETSDEALTDQTYALTSPILTDRSDLAAPRDLLAAASSDIGKAFNIFDTTLGSLATYAEVVGVWPNWTWELRVGWAIDSGHSGSYYRNSEHAIHLGDEAAYDDTIILHETGHYVHSQVSRSDSPGGTHYISDSLQDPRLSLSEGFATFWGSSVMESQGYGRSDIYVNTDGYTDLSFSYDIEKLERYSSTKGSASEARVTAALWDVVDGPDTRDASPGSDDDRMTASPVDWLEVFAGPMATNRSENTIEDFWEFWFAEPLAKGDQSGMEAVFCDQHSMPFREDLAEPNDSAAASLPVTAGAPSDFTLYPGDDLDWFRFTADLNSSYRILTGNLHSGADTVMTLFEAESAMQVGFNDDIFDDFSEVDGQSWRRSELYWTPPRAGEYQVQVRHYGESITHTEWGAYSLLAQRANTPEFTGAFPLKLRGEGLQRVLVMGNRFADQLRVEGGSDDLRVVAYRVINPSAVELYVETGAVSREIAVPFHLVNPGTQASRVALQLTISPETQPPLLLSEIDAGDDDAVEIHNRSASPVNVAGYVIRVLYSDSNVQYVLPEATISPGSFLTVRENDGGDDNLTVFLHENISWSTSGSGGCVLLDSSGVELDRVQWNELDQTGPSLLGWNWSDSYPGDETLTYCRTTLRYDSDSVLDWGWAPRNLGSLARPQTTPALVITSGLLPTLTVSEGRDYGLTLIALDQNRASGLKDSASVALRTFSHGVEETLELQEIQADCGIFVSRQPFRVSTVPIDSTQPTVTAPLEDVVFAMFGSGPDATAWARMVAPDPASSPTPTPVPAAGVQIAGYLDSILYVNEPGTLTLFVLASPETGLEMAFEGQPIGIGLMTDLSGVAVLTLGELNSPNAFTALLTLQSARREMWPFLDIRP